MTNRAALFGIPIAAFSLGYWIAPKEPLDNVVESRGFFTTTTTKVLSATVDSLRSENKLLVFSYKGTAKVRAEIDGLLFFNGQQDLYPCQPWSATISTCQS